MADSNGADQRWTINKNIERFRRLLDNERDQAKRRTLEDLLANERTKLADLDQRA